MDPLSDSPSPGISSYSARGARLRAQFEAMKIAPAPVASTCSPEPSPTDTDALLSRLAAAKAKRAADPEFSSVPQTESIPESPAPVVRSFPLTCLDLSIEPNTKQKEIWKEEVGNEKVKSSKTLRYANPASSRARPLHTDEANRKRTETYTKRKAETKARKNKKFVAKAVRNVSLGGRYNPRTRRCLTPDGLARKQSSISLINDSRRDFFALLNIPSTENLPSFYPKSSKFRSSAEHKFDTLINAQLFPDLSLSYSESKPRSFDAKESWFDQHGKWERRSTCSEVSLNWSGRRTFWVRDFDLSFKNHTRLRFSSRTENQPLFDEYQVQVKGANFLYHWAKDSCAGDLQAKYYPKEYQARFRKFLRLRNALLNFALRNLTNSLSHGYVLPETELVRKLLHVSASSINAWTKSKLTLDWSHQLLSLLQKESARFEDYWWDFLKALLPQEYRILVRAVNLFKDFASENPSLMWTQGQVARHFSGCLQLAKEQVGYDDSYSAVFRSWLRLDFSTFRFNLPKPFKPCLCELRRST
jgi:hypothetical protein